MKELNIREALQTIQPAEGAQERIYRDIMKKTAKTAAPRAGRTVRRLVLPLAACLLLAVGMAFALPREEPPVRRPVAVGSPVAQVDGPEALAPAGVFLDAPEGAEEVSCYLISGQIAKIHFTFRGKAYDCLASAVRTDDFSFAETGPDPEPVGRWTLSRSPDGRWKGELENGGIKAYLLNDGSADREELAELLQTIPLGLLN